MTSNLVLPAIVFCGVGLYQIIKTFINLYKNVSKPYSSLLSIIFGSLSTAFGLGLWIIFMS